MSTHKHKDKIHNNLDNTDIEVFIKESGNDRRGACRGGKSLVKSGESCELTGLRGKENIRLIVESRLVPSRRDGDPDGLEIKMGEKMQPHHMEFHSVSGNKFGFHLHFKEAIPDPEQKTHIDPEVKHPGGG